MRIGVTLGADRGRVDAVDEAVAEAREAARAGIGSVWFGQRFGADAIALAGLVGREVPEIEVGVSAVPVFGRHPVLVGSQALTAAAATGNRFRLGLAMGTAAWTERAFGLAHERPAARLAEFLTALGPLLTTGTTDHHGDLITAATPTPALVAGAKAPPVLVAAMGPRALRVSGALADGILPRLAGPRVLAERIVPTVTDAARQAGRADPAVLAIVPVTVTDRPDEARAAARERLAFYETVPAYRRILDEEGVERAGDLALVGDERAVRAGLRRYVDAGATELLIETDLDDPDTRRRTWEVVGGW